MRRSVAVIGSGMAGLAAAYGCRKQGWQVTLFEAQPAHGMDAHALQVDGGLVDVPLRVMNPSAWSSVLALAAEVGVDTFPVNTFVSCSWPDQRSWFRSGRLPLLHWPMVGSWRYLNGDSLRLALGLRRLYRVSRALDDLPRNMTVAELLQREKFDPLFWRGLALPLLTTICTCEEQHLLAWPASQLLSLLQQILHGDGLVRLRGGTGALVQGLAADLPRISGSPVQSVVEQGDQVSVHNARGEGGLFDQVIVATQANQLDFLQGERYQQEKAVLGDIRFDRGELVVHGDLRFMPRHRRDWTALNFRMDPALEKVMFTVWVNAVEPTLHNSAPVLQTWNPQFEPAADSIVARVPLQRAVVHAGTAAVHQQLKRWHAEPGRRIFYCGSWAHDGVPLLESAVRSANAVVERMANGTQA
ncbi:MAG: FAD-dependent oxidoreductase [Alcanivoracaceae bacterium]|jgi:predicted NAD/FAD-binding protein|nr:FAD-dependent oxidoreductase [Alcanivoracaceae bacterium]